MNITTPQLLAQYDHIINGDGRNWASIELQYHLPAMALFAVASRETNMQNIRGDYTQRPGERAPQYHGYGYFQRDSQWGVGPSYLADVNRQAVDAATLLSSNYRRFGSWNGAFAAYNSGQPNDQYTTGHDYGADVSGRMSVLQQQRGHGTQHPSSSQVGLLQQALKTTVDGKWGPATDMLAVGMRNAARAHVGYPTNTPNNQFDIKGVQHILGVAQDGIWGSVTQGKMADWVGIVQGAVLRVSPDKRWGPATDTAFLNLRSQNLNHY